jgi:hypothetical protein
VIRRPLLSFPTGVSLVLFAATSLVWARSYQYTDGVACEGPIDYRIQSRQGVIEAARIQFPLARQSKTAFRGFSGFYDDLEIASLAQLGASTQHTALGFQIWIHARNTLVRVDRLVVPDYACTLVFAVLPVFWMRRVARDKHLSDELQCLHCGYNLTGNTSGVCPECGTPVPKQVVWPF